MDTGVHCAAPELHIFVCALLHVLYFTVERFKNAYSMLPEGRYYVKLNHYISHIFCTNYLAQMVKNRLAMQEKGLDPWVRKIPWKRNLFQYPIILPFHTVHGVLKAKIVNWFAIPFSSDHILSYPPP